VAVLRENPYGQFNFLVDLGSGETDGPEAGLQECSEIGMTIDVIEYRNGNDRVNNVRKLPGLAHAGDVTLKRGIIGSLALYKWIDEIRNGDPGSRRNVRIHLQSEDYTQTVLTWNLLGAFPSKHSGGPLNARGTDVAIEELTLTYERLELE
jgi:phage tail-like protein